MTLTIAMRGLASVEHVQPDGSFVAYLPTAPVPPPIKPGDRVRVRLEAPDDTWIYAVSSIRQREYWSLGAWPPSASSGVRMLWPGGHVLTADDAAMTVLLLVASREELPWARDLVHTDCASLVGQTPRDPPITVCDHLYGLFGKVPPRVRGMVPPVVDFFEDGAARVPAIVVEHRGAPFTAIEWQFKPKRT